MPVYWSSSLKLDMSLVGRTHHIESIYVSILCQVNQIEEEMLGWECLYRLSCETNLTRSSQCLFECWVVVYNAFVCGTEFGIVTSLGGGWVTVFGWDFKWGGWSMKRSKWDALTTIAEKPVSHVLPTPLLPLTTKAWDSRCTCYRMLDCSGSL